MSSLEHAGRSDIGRQRAGNQDRWSADAALGLYVVADGIARSNNGELAAHIVTHVLPAYLQRHLDPSDLGDSDAATRLGRAVADVSDELYALGRSDPRVTGTGTTVVAALVGPS